MRIFIFSLLPLLFLILTFSPQAFAQGQVSSEISPDEVRRLLDSNQMPRHQSVNTTGTPYLFEDFHDGVFELFNGRTTRQMPLRYNSNDQSLEFLDGDIAYSVDSNSVKSFEIYIDNATHKFKRGYEASRLSKNDFVQIIIDDNLKLFARHFTTYQRDVPVYNSATRHDVYQSDVAYYVQIGDNDLERIRSLRERRVMTHINSHRDEIDAFIRSREIDFSKAEDVKQLFIYYNSLLAESSAQ